MPGGSCIDRCCLAPCPARLPRLQGGGLPCSKGPAPSGERRGAPLLLPVPGCRGSGSPLWGGGGGVSSALSGRGRQGRFCCPEAGGRGPAEDARFPKAARGGGRPRFVRAARARASLVDDGTFRSPRPPPPRGWAVTPRRGKGRRGGGRSLGHRFPPSLRDPRSPPAPLSPLRAPLRRPRSALRTPPGSAAAAPRPAPRRARGPREASGARERRSFPGRSAACPPSLPRGRVPSRRPGGSAAEAGPARGGPGSRPPRRLMRPSVSLELPIKRGRQYFPNRKDQFCASCIVPRFTASH